MSIKLADLAETLRRDAHPNTMRHEAACAALERVASMIDVALAELRAYVTDQHAEWCNTRAARQCSCNGMTIEEVLALLTPTLAGQKGQP